MLCRCKLDSEMDPLCQHVPFGNEAPSAGIGEVSRAITFNPMRKERSSKTTSTTIWSGRDTNVIIQTLQHLS